MNSQQKSLSGIRFEGIMVLCVLLAVTTFVGWPLCSESDTIHESKRIAELKEKLEGAEIPEIAVEYAKVKDEIQMRLEHEHSLFLYQFILMGGVFALILGQSGFFRRAEGNTNELSSLYENGFLALTLGISVIALLIVDIHIRYNTMVIEELGVWTRIYYECEIPAPAKGWETYWLSSENRHFYKVCPIWVAMLYLPTISLLLGYYALLFGQQPASWKTPTIVNKMVFGGVQSTIVLFAVINHWPIPRPSWWGWLLVLGWTISWGFISWYGRRHLDGGSSGSSVQKTVSKGPE